MADIARIEDRIDRVAASTLQVSDALGGLRFQNMVEVMEFAKCMAVADTAVPKHLRGNPGMCLAICIQALEWRFSPFAVANKSYVVNDRIGYESQLVHAVIEQRAPIVGRMKHRFDGEGEDRRCIVTAVLRETNETLEYISPPFSKIQPKNSPLWKTKPDLQLYYNTSRDFCRAYFPDVLLGVYSQEELRDHVGPDNAKDINERPSVGDRLKAKGARGFNASHVEQQTRGVVDESTTTKGDASHSETPQDATRHEQTGLNTENGATDAHRHPDRAKTLDDTSTGGRHEVTTAASEPVRTSDAPNSNSSEPPSQTDTPAAEQATEPQAAGNPLESSGASADDVDGGDGVSDASPSPSLPSEDSELSFDWRETYLRGMARVTDRPKSLPSRHTEALQLIGGKANAEEQEWMRAVYKLTERRLRGEITKADCEAAIREIS
ncbi:recombinase RecT [Bradyrhizobium sp. URHD0069]|uniref:recombinase RecT n=1 Tax=Bradyrhizobium sp. URHD0069 TaxID=1380355 RepID=UPI000561D28A|nr:recombinase RecT [Bradyrhizobium sp. URHD0069]